MRTAEAQGAFSILRPTELDQFDALRAAATQQFRIMCLCALALIQPHGPTAARGRSKVDDRRVAVQVQLWNAAPAVQKGQRYFSKVLTSPVPDKPLSISVFTIPEREIGDEMPVYGDYR